MTQKIKIGDVVLVKNPNTYLDKSKQHGYDAKSPAVVIDNDDCGMIRVQFAGCNTGIVFWPNEIEKIG